MIKIDLFTQSGEKKQISFDVAERFQKLNDKLVAQALYIEQNNDCRKSGHSKTKGEVSGGGRKPWKQKGTGRARAGSLRSPIFRGGGVTFGPRSTGKSLKLPKTMKNLVFGQLIVSKAKHGGVAVVDSFACKDAKTKNAASFAQKAFPGKQVIASFAKEEIQASIAWRNLPLFTCNSITDIKLNDLRSSKLLVLSENGAKELFNKYQK